MKAIVVAVFLFLSAVLGALAAISIEVQATALGVEIGTVSVYQVVGEVDVPSVLLESTFYTEDFEGEISDERVTVVPPLIEAEDLLINTEIVPEPGAIVLMTIGGGILSIIAMHRRRSVQ